MELLIIEDDPGVLGFLRRTLETGDWRVHSCSDCNELTEILASGTLKPEVIILDRMLRGRDGLKMVPEIKQVLPGSRILILSAINTPEEKAAALDSGVDDYLAKPFSSLELAARIRSLQRRGPQQSPSTSLSLGNLTLDLLAHGVFVNGRKIDLSGKEFKVLLALAQTPGRVFNKYQILNKVWDIQTEVESNVVEVTIKNIRNKLADAGASLKIENKRNVGYWVEN